MTRPYEIMGAAAQPSDRATFTDGTPRHVIVIASQCESMPYLKGLGEAAERLYAVLRDPAIGACSPGLRNCESLLIGTEDSPLTQDDIDSKLRAAIRFAGDTGATLILAIMGHGFALPGSGLYFEAWDSSEDRPLSSVNVTEHLTTAIAEPAIDGLVALIDTCMATNAVPTKQDLIAGFQGGRTRFAALMASGSTEPAYGLALSRTIAKVLAAGVSEKGETIRPVDLLPTMAEEMQPQAPSLLLFDGLGWVGDADLGLWLGRNLQTVDNWHGTLDSEWVRKLTASYYDVPARWEIVNVLRTARLIFLLGGSGTGKSVLMARLSQAPAGDRDALHALVFCNAGMTAGTVADMIGQQLAARLGDPGTGPFAVEAH